MATIDQDYIKDLDMYLNAKDDFEPEEDVEIQQGIKGNISVDDIRDSEQALLYMVIDKSGSMYNNGLEDAVRKGLDDVKRVVNGSKEVKCIQTAMTFFGSSLDMRPFQYGECIDTSYEANEASTRLYDAVVESCKNMISQYDTLKPTAKVKGVMLIFTDGGENGSELYHDAKEVQKYLDELRKRDIPYLVASFKGVDGKQLARDFKTEPITIDDDHKLRRLMRFVSERAMR